MFAAALPAFSQTPTKVEGAIAQGAVPSTNPISMAVVDPTGNAGAGKLIFMRGQPSGLPIAGVVAAGADGLTNNQVLYQQGINGATGAGDLSGWSVTAPLVFNGSTYDRMRGNTQGISVTGWSGAGGGSPAAMTVCERSVTFTTSSTALLQQITGTGGTKLRVCNVTASSSGGTQSFSLYSGTGTNCGTGQTGIASFMYIPALDTKIIPGTGIGQWIELPTGTNLCLATSAANLASFTITFTAY